MPSPDWGQGLPAGVLSLVSELGGCDLMKAMRGVNHVWREEFDLSVTGITIHKEGPPPANSFSGKFPSLTNLAVGDCRMDEAGLAGLAGMRRLVKLRLGLAPAHPPNHPLPVGQLARNLTRAGLQHIRSLPLTSLHLGYCRKLVNADLELLQGMPLKTLILKYCSLSEPCFAALAGLPLTSLDLECGPNLQSAAGVQHLLKLPLTDLDLGYSMFRKVECLALLAALPLRRLGLAFWRISDEALEHLRGMPLTQLNLKGSNITDAGLAHLRGMNLSSLDLSLCRNLTLPGMEQLRGMPMKRLNVCFGNWGGRGTNPAPATYPLTPRTPPLSTRTPALWAQVTSSTRTRQSSTWKRRTKYGNAYKSKRGTKPQQG